MQTILITGINGYLGSYLAKALSVRYKIIGIEYSSENLYRLEGYSFKVYSTIEVENIFIENGIDIIIHTATLYGKNNEELIQMLDSNLNSPLKLLNQALKHKCKLFINTDTVLDRFISPYALTKRQFQEWLYLKRNEIKVINMQLQHFYGPGASSLNFISGMIARLRNNEQQIDLTKGEQMRNFIYIDDVVNAYLTVIEKQNLITDSYSSFQVCTSQLISIKELMILLKRLTSSKTILNFGALSYRENELMQSETNNSVLMSFGWKPSYSIEEGLELTCLHF
jgi:CDP-paratose synthetase